MTTEQQGQHSDAVKIDMLLRQVVTTPEGSTAMFVNFQCTDRERLEAMKSNPKDVLYSTLRQKYDGKALEAFKERIDNSQINALQNEENHWHIVLPPRNGAAMDLPDDYLEKVSAGEAIAFASYVTMTTLGASILGFAAGFVPVALTVSGMALTGALVGSVIAVGGLAAAGKI